MNWLTKYFFKHHPTATEDASGPKRDVRVKIDGGKKTALERLYEDVEAINQDQDEEEAETETTLFFPHYKCEQCQLIGKKCRECFIQTHNHSHKSHFKIINNYK